MSTGKGGGGFVSPYTGEVFTSRFAFNDHCANWPTAAEANGLNLDGTPRRAAAPTPAKPSGAKGKPKKRG